MKVHGKQARENASPLPAILHPRIRGLLCTVLVLLTACAPTTTPPVPTTPPATAVPTVLPTPAPLPTLLPAPTLSPPPALGLQRLWRTATNDTVWQVGPADVEGDGQLEVYVASYDHSLYLLAGDGTVQWSFATAAPVYAALPTDLDGDGRPEFLCGGDDDTVHAVDSTGQERWSYPTSGRVTHLAAGDLDGDDRPEVAAADWEGRLYLLDAAGQEITRTLLLAQPTFLTALDLDGDHQAELLVGANDGTIRALDATGSVLWRHGLEGSVRAVVTADVDQDGRQEVAVASQTGVLALIGADGVPRWAVRAAGTILSLAALSQDHLLLLGRAEGLLALSAATGEPAWEQPTTSGVWTIATLESPAAEPVIAAGMEDGSILLLNPLGQICGRTQLPSRVHTVAWADLESKGLAELLARSGDYVYAFRQVTKGEVGEGVPEVPTFPHWPEPSPFPPTPEGDVVLVVGGDVMVARSIEERMVAFGPDYPFRAVAPLLQQADIAVANLECVLSLGGTPAVQPFILRAHPSMVNGLQEAGFDVLNLANNHSLDYGPAGLADTIAMLESHNIHAVGAGPEGAEPVVLEVRGLRVAILARNASPNSPADLAGAWDKETLQRDIRAARTQADVVVLLLHTGQDPTAEPDADQRGLARAAIDAGAVLVVGFHRYQVLDTEAYQEGFIAYALGDLVSDIDIEDTARDGVLLRVLLNRQGLGRVDWIPTRSVNDVQPRAVEAPGGRLASRPLVLRTSEPLAPAPSPRPTYVLSATVAPEEGLLTVRERVAFPNSTGDLLDDLNLFVLPNALTGTFFLQDVAVQQRGRLLAPSYALAGTTLHVFLADSVRPGEAVTLSLVYSLSLPLLDAEIAPPIDNLGYTSDGRIVQLGHWYPQLVPYRHGYGWDTWEYHPVGDPFFTDLAAYQVMLTAPAGARVFAAVPGRLEGVNHYFSQDPVRDFALLVTRDYDTLTQVVDGITVTSAFRPEDSEAGRAALDNVARALRLFQKRYGPYPYKTFTVVEGEMFGGMEYSGMVLIGSPFYEAYQSQADHKEQTVLPTLVVHELSHQWWYNVVGNDQVHEPWLDESLARYSELIYYQEAYSQSVDWWWQSRVDGWGPSGYLDDTIYDYTDTLTYVHNLYGIGAHFIHDVRARMGDDVFFSFLQRYYREYAWQRVTRRDFFRLVGDTGVAVDDLVQVYFRK